MGIEGNGAGRGTGVADILLKLFSEFNLHQLTTKFLCLEPAYLRQKSNVIINFFDDSAKEIINFKKYLPLGIGIA